MSCLRYSHADNDAPLYRVKPTMGGKAWPAHRVYDEGNRVRVTLDIDGDLVTFWSEDVTALAPPEAMPDWALDVIKAAVAYEIHGRDQIESAIARMPADARTYFEAWSRS